MGPIKKLPSVSRFINEKKAESSEIKEDPNKISGLKIKSVHPHHETIVFTDGDNTYFVEEKELIKLFKKFDWKLEKKRTRTWATVDGLSKFSTTFEDRSPRSLGHGGSGPDSVYQLWLDKKMGNFGSFQTAMMQAYLAASSDNKKKLDKAYPEWFVGKVK